MNSPQFEWSSKNIILIDIYLLEQYEILKYINWFNYSMNSMIDIFFLFIKTWNWYLIVAMYNHERLRHLTN